MSEHDPNVPQPPQPPMPPEQPTGAMPPPAAEPAPTPPPQAWQQGPSGPRASFGRRLVAYLVDFLLLGIADAVFRVIFNEGVGAGVGLLVGVAYFTFLDGGPRGQTLGKMALGIRVIDFNTGGSIGYPRGVVRYIGLILSAIPCFLGYLWMLWDREKQCWQDKLATSVVVPVEYYPVS
jgi:uncharacterized RDD family membrane protein YckC